MSTVLTKHLLLTSVRPLDVSFYKHLAHFFLQIVILVTCSLTLCCVGTSLEDVHMNHFVRNTSNGAQATWGSISYRAGVASEGFSEEVDLELTMIIHFVCAEFERSTTGHSKLWQLCVSQGVETCFGSGTIRLLWKMGTGSKWIRKFVASSDKKQAWTGLS